MNYSIVQESPLFLGFHLQPQSCSDPPLSLFQKERSLSPNRWPVFLLTCPIYVELTSPPVNQDFDYQQANCLWSLLHSQSCLWKIYPPTIEQSISTRWSPGQFSPAKHWKAQINSCSSVKPDCNDKLMIHQKSKPPIFQIARFTHTVHSNPALHCFNTMIHQNSLTLFLRIF